jgi:hypothetical protein
MCWKSGVKILPKVLLMTKTTLTPAFIKSVICPIGCERLEYFDTDMAGFSLEVRVSGGQTHYQRYRD